MVYWMSFFVRIIIWYKCIQMLFINSWGNWLCLSSCLTAAELMGKLVRPSNSNQGARAYLRFNLPVVFMFPGPCLRYPAEQVRPYTPCCHFSLHNLNESCVASYYVEFQSRPFLYQSKGCFVNICWYYKVGFWYYLFYVCWCFLGCICMFNTISWQFITIFQFGKLVANLYGFIWSHLYNLLMSQLFYGFHACFFFKMLL